MGKELNALIKSFAVDILGCGCSDDVFENIEVDADYSLPGAQKLQQRILIGNRLLIYIVDGDSLLGDTESVEGLLKAGRDDRDQNKYNRFRLVLACSEKQEDNNGLMNFFEHFAGNDEKIHLHILSKDVIEFH